MLTIGEMIYVFLLQLTCMMRCCGLQFISWLSWVPNMRTPRMATQTTISLFILQLHCVSASRLTFLLFTFIYSYGILSCQQDITTGLYLPYLQAFALNHSRFSFYPHCSSKAPNTLQINFIGGCQHGRVTTRTIILISTTCLKPAGL